MGAIGFIKKSFSAKVGKLRVLVRKYWRETRGLLFFVVVYGLVLNYVAAVFFKAIFLWWTFLAYGFAWYFVKYEITNLFHIFRGFKE